MTARQRARKLRARRIQLASAVGLAAAGAAAVSPVARATLLFDNITNRGGTTITQASPNTFIGDGYNVGAGATDLTGFDLSLVNVSGTDFTGGVQANVYFWGGVNTTGTVNATTPAFSNLLATTTVTFTGDIQSGYIYSIQSTTPGTTPGISFTNPLNLSSGSGGLLGVSVNYTGSTDGGMTFASAFNLTSGIAFNSSVSPGATPYDGYYRNVNSETNGNFTAGLRTLGYNTQSMAIRLYGDTTGVIGGNGSSGTTHNWATAASGNWNTAANWTPATVPAATDPTVFNTSSDGRTAAGYTVTLPTAITAASIAVQSDRVTFDLPIFASSLTLSGPLAVGQPATAGAATYGFATLSNSTATGVHNASVGSVAVGTSNGGVGSLTVGSLVKLAVSGDTNIASGSMLVISPKAALAGNTLTLAGTTNAWTGKVDITSGVMDLSGASLATVSNQVKQGFNLGGAGGTFAGTGGITSSVAAADAAHLTAVGVIQNNQGSGTPVYTAANPFSGLVPGAADILVKYTFYGDTNLDGVVNAADYTRIDAGFVGKLTGWFNGDFNYDGTVDGSDYSLMDNAFNQQSMVLSNAGVLASSAALFTSEPSVNGLKYGGTFGGTAVLVSGSAQSAAVTAAVPEPTALAAMAIAGATLVSRRRRR